MTTPLRREIAPDLEARRQEANTEAVRRLCEAEPVLVDVQPAFDVVPGMTKTTILTAGAPLPWSAYTGGQRCALIGAALFEGLAADEQEAVRRFDDGSIQVSTAHQHGCIGSVAGIYTASMPVFVVENQRHGNVGFCNLYEGESRRRLNYGVYDSQVAQGLRFLEQVVAPVLGAAVRRSGGVPLKPIMARALRMGDELHSRNTAATTLFVKELMKHFIDMVVEHEVEGDPLRRTVAFFSESDYSFLRLAMAAAKATADAAHGIEYSTVMTAMTFSCRAFSIRVSGLPDMWFGTDNPEVDAKLFEPYTPDDIEWIGGESPITETVGLGGFAQASAFALQAYQGGSASEMIRMNEAMYGITLAEHPDFRIPYFGFRGTPVGVDILTVIDTGVRPVIDAGLVGKGGVGQIGAGILRPPMTCFTAARDAWFDKYAKGSTTA